MADHDISDQRSSSPEVLIPLSAEQYDRRQKRVRWIVVAVIAVILGTIGYAYKRYTDPMRARETYDSAERLFRVARYTQAIVSLDRAISYQPYYADAYLLRGRARANIGELDNAVEDFTKVIEIQPGDPEAYLERGAAYNLRMDYPHALADCDKALAANPKMAAAHNLKGSVIRTMGDLKAALAEFTFAVELEQNLDNYFQRGATYQQMGEHKLAIADFSQAISFSPLSAQPYFARAESKRALGDNEGAQKDHLQGRRLDGR